MTVISGWETELGQPCGVNVESYNHFCTTRTSSMHHRRRLELEHVYMHVDEEIVRRKDAYSTVLHLVSAQRE